MAKCPECKLSFRTMEDEEGMHECPSCGYHPSNELNDIEVDNEDNPSSAQDEDFITDDLDDMSIGILENFYQKNLD